MTKIIFLYILALFLASCSSKPIYYHYKGVTVTRVDRDGEVVFYYGNCKKRRNNCPSVKATYSGFNSGIDAYLIFNPDSTVRVVHMMGYFTHSKNNNGKIYIKNIGNSHFDSLINAHKQLGNLIRVSDVVELEKEDHNKAMSKVMAEYPEGY